MVSQKKLSKLLLRIHHVELGVPFQGTPKVHAGIPHMNFWGPPKPWKTLKIYDFVLRPHYFEVFWEKGDPQSSCGKSPHELCPAWTLGSPKRGLQIHMEGRQVHMGTSLWQSNSRWIMAGHILWGYVDLQSWPCFAHTKRSNPWTLCYSQKKTKPRKNISLEVNQHKKKLGSFWMMKIPLPGNGKTRLF